MKAVLYDRHGPADEVAELETKFPRAFIDARSDEVLVRVKAASLTYRDLREVHCDFRSVGRAEPFPRVLG